MHKESPMKATVFSMVIGLFSSAALASDCGSSKMKPTDAQAPAASKVAEGSKVRSAAQQAERDASRLVAQNATMQPVAAQPATR